MTTTMEPRVDPEDTRSGAPTPPPRPEHRSLLRIRGMGYLPALDGLRAVAVLAVLAFHADLPWAPGGFLGVDVFFVLSGFLITTLLLESAARRGAPDLRQFYLRRARRLLPALTAVLIGSTLLVVTLAPDAAGNQQRDLPAALTYVTNWVYIVTDQSYFEATGRPPMLEHLWSLAVEEQFYILWPWVFLLAWRAGRGRFVGRVAGIGALLSTALMLVLSVASGSPADSDPSRVYFGTDTHVMGLLVGAGLATVWIPRSARSAVLPGARAVIDGIGVAALLALLLVFWQVSEESSLLYRGGFLLISCLVALLIVAVTHPASRFGSIVGCAPMRYLGTRSYGIYLWHWPVFLVTRPGLDVPLTGTANLALRIGLTLGIAELSYRFLETPVRRYGFRGAWNRMLAVLAAGPRSTAGLARRPAALVAIIAIVLAGMGLRLYALPSGADYLGGVTSLTAAEPEATPPNAGTADSSSPAPEGESPAPAAPRVAPGQLGIGESVMIGAGRALQREFPELTIDADVGRQQDDQVARVRELAAAGSLREDIILHMGSNGFVGPNSVRAVLDTFAEEGVSRIAVVNISVPRRWQDPNNDVLATVVQEYPNAVLVDWHAAVLDDPDLVVADGIHPSGSGIAMYASLIADGFAELEAEIIASEAEDAFVDDEPIMEGGMASEESLDA